MTKESSFVVMTIECPHCKGRQNIHIDVRPGIGRKEREYISSINCHREFEVRVPDKIVCGPFIA